MLENERGDPFNYLVVSGCSVTFNKLYLRQGTIKVMGHSGRHPLLKKLMENRVKNVTLIIELMHLKLELLENEQRKCLYIQIESMHILEIFRNCNKLLQYLRRCCPRQERRNSAQICPFKGLIIVLCYHQLLATSFQNENVCLANMTINMLMKRLFLHISIITINLSSSVFNRVGQLRNVLTH